METDREAAQLVELRVSLSEARAELGRLRADLSPLTGLPALLRSQAEVTTLQLRNIEQRIDREVQNHHDDIQDVRTDISELMEWRTWALRLVVGAVFLAIVAVVMAAPVTP